VSVAVFVLGKDEKHACMDANTTDIDMRVRIRLHLILAERAAKQVGRYEDI
jgi:hypothetical protein